MVFKNNKWKCNCYCIGIIYFQHYTKKVSDWLYGFVLLEIFHPLWDSLGSPLTCKQLQEIWPINIWSDVYITVQFIEFAHALFLNHWTSIGLLYTQKVRVYEKRLKKPLEKETFSFSVFHMWMDISLWVSGQRSQMLYWYQIISPSAPINIETTVAVTLYILSSYMTI